MSQPPLPPQQQQRPPAQDRAAPPQDRAKGESQSRKTPTSRARDQSIAEPEQEVRTDATPGLESVEVTVVAGKTGEKNLAHQWVDVWLPGGKPMYIIVTTRPEHELQVMIEQRSWKKNYTARGRVQTDVTPIAPVGTTGKLIAKDLATGEELTVSFVWHWLVGPSLFARLVKLVKRLFTNQKA